MTRQTIPISVQPKAYPNPRTAAVALAAGFLAADVGNGSQFVSVGREVLAAWNTDTPTNEVQTITTAGGTITNGNFTLSVVLDGVTYTTGNIVYTATPSAVQTALLAAVDSNGTSVATRYPALPTANTALVGSGTALPAGTVTITFRYGLGGQVIATMGVDNAGLTGGTLGVTEGTPGAGQHSVTVLSVPDSPFNRTADITKVVGAGNIEFFPYFQAPGWRQADGNIYLSADNNKIFFAVVQTPAQ